MKRNKDDDNDKDESVLRWRIKQLIDDAVVIMLLCLL